MTFSEWVAAVDALVSITPATTIDADAADALRARNAPHFAPGDAAWMTATRTVAVRVSEDDAALRGYFLDLRDGAARHHERTYVRSEPGTQAAAHDITTFLTSG